MNRQINGVEQPQGEPAASAWREGEPPHPWNSEWFLARMRQGGIVVLRPLPEEYTYDYTTADGTYVKRESIVQWAQLSISSYVAPKDTHADPGEVERLRAQLAERDALLHSLDCAWNSHDGKERFGKLMRKVETLAASAEPSVPAAQPGKCLDGGDCGIGGTCKWCPHTTASPAQQPS